MRCEANVSLQEEDKFTIAGAEVKPIAGYHLNPKVELKNINSFRAVEKRLNTKLTARKITEPRQFNQPGNARLG